MKQSGIYLISSDSGKVYVGSTRSSVGFRKRWRYHIQDIERGTHGNRHLMRHAIKHGIGCLSFMQLEVCSDSELEKREVYWMGAFQSLNPRLGFNLIGPKRGMVSEETRHRMSIARRAHKMTEAHKRNIGSALIGNTNCLGRVVSEETRLKISIAHTGMPSPCKGRKNPKLSRSLVESHLRRKVEYEKNPEFAAFKALFLSGLSCSLIAERFGHTMTWAWKVAKRYGLTRPKKK